MMATMRCLLAAFLVIDMTLALNPLSGQKLVSVVPTNQYQLNLLVSEAENGDKLDFWTYPRMNVVTDIMVPGRQFTTWRQNWTEAGMEVTVKQEDVEKLIRDVELQNEQLKLQDSRLFSDAETTLNHNRYRSYREMRDDLVTLRETFGDQGLIRFDETGKTLPLPRTVRRRLIHYVELGTADKPVIMIEVNIHAREWITSAANFYMIDKLLTGYGSDDDADFLLDNYRLVIIPVANPDGYEYSRLWSGGRLWRKNRRRIRGLPFFGCYGVDLNRNFDFQWSRNLNCRSETYSGPNGNSEAETQAIQTLFNAYKDDMVIYLSVHCYSQVLIVPLALDSNINPVNDFHTSVGEAMASAMEDVDDRTYESGTARQVIGYNAYGTSTDWALLEKVDEGDLADDRSFLAIAFEMRPSASSSNGFILPASQIVPTGKELLAGVVTAAREYKDENPC